MPKCDDTAHEFENAPEATFSIEASGEPTTYHCDAHFEEMVDLLDNEGATYTTRKL